MKKCPFCAEEIQDQAVKCRYCSEFLDRVHNPKTKWYFTTSTVVIALLCLGPLALPLVWFNPRYKIITKFTVTVIVIAASILASYMVTGMYHQLTEQIKELGLS